MFGDCKKSKVHFEYKPFEDSRLNITPPMTAWESYYQEKLFKQSEIRQKGASGIETVGISLTNSLTKKLMRTEMFYDGYNKKYTIEVDLEPGLYFYEFVLNPHKPFAEQIWITDTNSNIDLKIPKLECPGFRYSGVMVYPDFSCCGNNLASLENSRARVTNIDGFFYEINLAAVGFESAELLTLDENRISFEVIKEYNGVKYLYIKNYINPNNMQFRIVLKSNCSNEYETIIENNHLIENSIQWTDVPDSSDFFETPEWSKKAVWYNLMPDRFRYCGNDEKIKKYWKQDWYSLRDYETQYYPDIYYREYKGNLDGLIEKLDYLQELGVNAICVTPVFWGSGYHKYHTIDLRHIDPEFGPDPEHDIKILEDSNETLDPSTWVFTKADKKFIELVENIHRRNMKIIIDGVFSHTGEFFWAFKDLLKNREKSEYFDWFAIEECTDEKLEYLGFFGMRELPKLKLYGTHQAPLFDKHLYDITKRWMDPDGNGNTNKGVDGWRLDVANELPVEFWRNWRKHVKSINKDAFILGEMMFTSYEPYLVDSFDSIINYRFGEGLFNYFIKKDDAYSVGQFVQFLKENAIKYNAHSNYSMQNILDSHDTDRISSMIKNKKRGYCCDNKIQYSYHHYDGSAPSAEDFRILRLLIAFQIAYIGAPSLYYGTESGMWGGNDPHCRKPMLWDDMGKYENENLCYPADPNNLGIVNKLLYDHELKNEISYLYNIRKDNDILSLGKIDYLDYSDDDNWLSLVRFDDSGHGYIFVFNKSNTHCDVCISTNIVPCKIKKIEDISYNRGEGFSFNDGCLRTSVESISYKIFQF